SFKDMAVTFTKEALGLLDLAQRKLYHEVMLENFWNLVSMGYQPFTLDILQLGREEQLWVMEPETRGDECSGHRNQNEIETLQEVGLRHILHEGLMCGTSNSDLLRYLEENGSERVRIIREVHKSKMAFGNNNCGKDFVRNTAQHSIIHSEGQISGENGKGINLGSDLELQQQLQVGEEPHMCSEYGKGLDQSSHMQTHQRANPGEKPYRCLGPIHPRVDLYRCGRYRKGFSHVLDLNSCCVDNTEEKSWKCELCGKGSNKISQLQAHQTAYPEDKTSKWNTCDRMFSQHSVRPHTFKPIRIHTREKPYKCDVCDKNFSWNFHLQAHQSPHRRETLKCDMCGKDFSQISHLQAHQRVHIREKPYRCDTCGKGFSQSSHIQDHQWAHTREKPYMCDVCGNGFSWNSNLQAHQRKPCKCSMCGKSFSQNSHLHWRVHTGEKPYKCFDW
ncbi:hypothetical protein FD754_012392, partial [Muntiacus muntjak]